MGVRPHDYSLTSRESSCYRNILTPAEYKRARGDVAAATGDAGAPGTFSPVPDVDWSDWRPLFEAVETAPRLPGVYMVRRVGTIDVAYIGSAGERRGSGLRGRLRVYTSGKAAVSGQGEAVLDRALAQPDFIRGCPERAEAGTPLRVKELSRLAMERAEFEVRWTTVASKAEAEALEHQLIAAARDLWNRRGVIAVSVRP